ncbi:MAG: response regulator [Candidatus Thermoplasmatota archaeon]|jgi:two-component system alkaline phosphatase synthesis response regulator PhoP|nr:response regulator [Candidatus Thermoplasmatota archaeon]
MTKKIMVVDDDPSIIYTVKHGLEALDPDFSIIGANSGEQCLKLLTSEIPDVILLDIMMPGMTGWETINKIKQNDSWKTIPIILLTARTDRIAKDAGAFLADDYIEKPFQIQDIKQRIDKVLTSKSSKKNLFDI